MISAPLPKDEKERLQALYKYEILDTNAEKVFDDLTQLASEICDTPIALISLIDPNRQWFKSKVGLSVEETSRDIAFCAHAIHQKEIFEVCDTHEDERFKDNPLVTEDPNIRFYAGTPLQTPEGFVIGTLCTISDKPKQLDQHQRKALEILGREVISQLELRLKIKQLEEISQRKTDFMSNLSHELRTPLNAIISLSQLMLKDKPELLAQNHLSYLKHIDFSGKRLLDLVNSILDLNKIESGSLELNRSSVSVDVFFDSIEGVINSIANDKDVHTNLNVVNNGSTHIHVDEAQLSQIILNLASNAIKFSSAGQTVQIDSTISDKALTLAVRDSGQGIARQDIPLLFNRFSQVGNGKLKEGSGLGLTITKSLVELMQGDIKLNSELGKGTLVKVKIPLVVSAGMPTSDSANSLEPHFSQSAHILVVEDNQINQEVAKAIFQSIGLQIHIADSGEHALELGKQQHYDLVFMDLHLPGIDGYQTSRELKHMLPELPIVALTADVFAQHNGQLEQAGMSAALNKPIELSHLISILNLHCPKF